LQGREPQGIVRPGSEYEALLDEISADLQRLTDPETGLPFIDRVYRRDELYQGPKADRAPDLVFAPRNWSHQPFGLHELGSHRWLEPSRDRSGTHRLDGFFAMRGRGVRPGTHIQGAAIVDIAPTVLALLAVPIPADIDGRVLSTVLDDGLLAELGITYTQAGEALPGQPVPEMSQEDEEMMRQHLRGLGYVA
jgi:predicted AlkP superfamily phosphohydrolase/phosphomutase